MRGITVMSAAMRRRVARVLDCLASNRERVAGRVWCSGGWSSNISRDLGFGNPESIWTARARHATRDAKNRRKPVGAHVGIHDAAVCAEAAALVREGWTPTSSGRWLPPGQAT